MKDQKLTTSQSENTRLEELKKLEKYRIPMVDGATLQDLDLPPREFIVDGLIPCGLALLTAAQKTGKSWMALDLCLSVAQGTHFLGCRTMQAEALYLALEDNKTGKTNCSARRTRRMGFTTSAGQSLVGLILGL